MIVIDDGSSDDSADIVSAFDDARIRLIREAATRGLATRLNQAVAMSRGEFIARMDADDICFSDRLERQVARLRQDPHLDLLGCGAVVFSGDGQLFGELPISPTHEAITAQPFRGFPLPHPTWCGRAAWFAGNPYDPKMIKSQDQDLLLRTHRHSHFAALDDVLVGYRQDALDLGKMLLARRMFMGSIWREARRSGMLVSALHGIALQLVKCAVDIAALRLALGRFAQLYRLRPVQPSVSRRWNDHRSLVGVASESTSCAG